MSEAIKPAFVDIISEMLSLHIKPVRIREAEKAQPLVLSFCKLQKNDLHL